MRWEEATGMAVWRRDYTDPHLRVLIDPDGPFFDCDAARNLHTVPAILPLEKRPRGLFRSWDHAERTIWQVTAIGLSFRELRATARNISDGVACSRFLMAVNGGITMNHYSRTLLGA